MDSSHPKTHVLWTHEDLTYDLISSTESLGYLVSAEHGFKSKETGIPEASELPFT